MTTNLNGTFAAVQAASRELALLSDDTINQCHAKDNTNNRYYC